MAQDVTVRINWREYTELVWQPNRETGDWLRKVGRVVDAAMSRAAPVSPDGSYDRPAGYMARSVRHQLGRDGRSQYVDIGPTATTPDGHRYPIDVEFGTRPHVIESKGPWPLRNPKTGQVFGRIVHHPGTTAQPFIRPALLHVPEP